MFYCFFSVYSSCIHFSSERYFNDIQTISSIPGVEWRENNSICDSLFFSCRVWILLGKGSACVTLLRHRISQTREWNTNHSKRSCCVELAFCIGDDEFWLLGPSFKVKQLDCRQKIHFFYFRKPIALLDTYYTCPVLFRFTTIFKIEIACLIFPNSAVYMGLNDG